MYRLTVQILGTRRHKVAFAMRGFAATALQNEKARPLRSLAGGGRRGPSGEQR